MGYFKTTRRLQIFCAMKIIRSFQALFSFDGPFWWRPIMSKRLEQDNQRANLIRSALQYLPQKDGIDWIPICIRVIDQLDETLARQVEEWPEIVPLTEWRRTNPVAIASGAFDWMPIEYKFGTREKWLRRLDQVYLEERARFMESEKLRLLGSIDGTR
jgi:hypothetical protein